MENRFKNFLNETNLRDFNQNFFFRKQFKNEGLKFTDFSKYLKNIKFRKKEISKKFEKKNNSAKN